MSVWESIRPTAEEKKGFDSMKFAHSTDNKNDIIIVTKGEMLMSEEKMISYSNYPNFTGRNVPISEIAKAIGKSPDIIRYAIKEGIFHFRIAIQSESGSINYCCSNKKVWEETGYFNSELSNCHPP